MAKRESFPLLAVGIGIGVAAALLVMNRELRSRLAEAWSNGSQRISRVLPDPDAIWNRGEKAMSDVTDKLKNKIDDASDAGKKVVDKVVDKSKDAAHQAGKHLERGGKRLQDA